MISNSTTTATATRDLPSNRYAINADWLMKLRWVAVVGQLTTIVVVEFGLRIEVQLAPLFVALAVTVATNLVFTYWLRRLGTGRHRDRLDRRVWHRVFLSLMLLDLVVLTLLLYFTGGHANPFSLFYFVNLTLSGILLSPSRAWLLHVLSLLCFGVLLYFQVPLDDLRSPDRLLSIGETGKPTLGHFGLVAAFAACSSVIVYFVTRLSDELQKGDDALRFAQVKQARTDKWEALGTLSAGAAHELATPLTTIAVVSKELERELAHRDLPADVVGDIELIRREVDRCRTILNRMSIDAGHATAETDVEISVCELVAKTIEELPQERSRVAVDVPAQIGSRKLKVPLQSVLQAVRGVVQNALDASDRDVSVSSEVHGDRLTLIVRDEGEGMSDEVLNRADEPFFTTKEAGKGMGLGRFLARTVFERLGGRLGTKSEPGKGTTVKIELPLMEQSP